jgi:riboflavin synthase alpha subunit
VAVIPHTLKNTTLGALGQGSLVNVETDLVARQIVAYLKSQTGNRQDPRAYDLTEMGF